MVVFLFGMGGYSCLVGVGRCALDPAVFVCSCGLLFSFVRLGSGTVAGSFIRQKREHAARIVQENHSSLVCGCTRGWLFPSPPAGLCAGVVVLAGDVGRDPQ